METLRQDLRYALRQLRKRKGFIAVAVLTLALGIGANTTVFSIVSGVLLRPLPWEDPGRLVSLRETTPDDPNEDLSYANFRDWRTHARSFEAMAAYDGVSFNLAGGIHPEHVAGTAVSANLFRLLGVEPRLGRGFLPSENRENAPAVVVLSHSLWTNRFGADTAVVGRTVRLDGVPHTVVGVMPRGFRFPYDNRRLWVPLRRDPTANRGGHDLEAIGRLAPGATLEQANAELDAIARRLEARCPETNAGRRASAVPVRQAMLGASARTMLYLMLGATGFVLLIACANLANLMLARGTGRQREIAVRTALGAGRWRIVRQLLTESALLALLGGAAGVLVGFWGLEALRAMLPGGKPSWMTIAIDARVLGFTTVVAAGTALLFGLLPALRATRPDVRDVLENGGRGTSGADGPRQSRLRGGLVAAQIALAFVLLIGAGLLTRSVLELQSVDPGFDPRHTATMQLTLSGSRYETGQQRLAFWQRLLRRVRAVPGTRAVAAVNNVPLSNSGSGREFFVEGQEPALGEAPVAVSYATAGEYLRAMGIPLLRGRTFTPAEVFDTAARVLLINERMAERYWPESNPIGERIRFDRAPDAPWYTVVGVVGNVRHWDLGRDPAAQTYLPYGSSSQRRMTLVARTAGDPTAIVREIRRAVASLDDDLPVFEVQTLAATARQSVWRDRVFGRLFASFGAVALLLAAVGVYGVISYSVARRTREFGIRMALGANAGSVVRLVVRHAVVLALVGVGTGVAAGYAVTRLLSSLLYRVSPTDPLVFAAVAVLLAGVAMLASYVPARRAARVDPMTALRHE